MSQPAGQVETAGGPGGAGEGGERKAYQSGASWARFILPAAIGVAADLWLKAWAFPNGVGPGLESRHPAPNMVPVIPDILGFNTTVNHGAVFGIGQGMVGIFLAFSVLALGVITWVFVTTGEKQRITHIALGLITAGALGNLYDRAIYGGVRDMLQFYAKWYPYIFNLADVFLCVGVPLLVMRWLFVKEKDARKDLPGFDVLRKS